MSFLILWQVLAPDHTNVATRPSRRLPARKHLGPPTAGHMEMSASCAEAWVMPPLEPERNRENCPWQGCPLTPGYRYSAGLP